MFFEEVEAEGRRRRLLSDEHGTLDGTLVDVWAGTKSFRRRAESGGGLPPEPPAGGAGLESRNPTVDFLGKSRSNTTHQPTTDPDAPLYQKSQGTESKLSYLGHVLMENRNGLAVDGSAEREAAIGMIAAVPTGGRIILGADRG